MSIGYSSAFAQVAKRSSMESLTGKGSGIPISMFPVGETADGFLTPIAASDAVGVYSGSSEVRGRACHCSIPVGRVFESLCESH